MDNDVQGSTFHTSPKSVVEATPLHCPVSSCECPDATTGGITSQSGSITLSVSPGSNDERDDRVSRASVERTELW